MSEPTPTPSQRPTTPPVAGGRATAVTGTGSEPDQETGGRATAGTGAGSERGHASAVDWESVYREHFTKVWRFLARLGAKPADLEDLAHDVFLTAFKRIDAFDPTRPVLPWLYGIAVRLASDNRRLASHLREVASDELPEVAAGGQTADAAVEARQARALLEEVLASLDLEKRAVFVMHELDGLTVPDIARAVDVPVPTAYSRLRLARQQFDAGVKRLRAKVSHESAA